MATKTKAQTTLALEPALEQVKESLEQAIEQGPAYELTAYASTANGNKICRLANGNYQEVNEQGQLIGNEYPEAMFSFALQSGFLVEASLLAGVAKVKEKPKFSYRIDFSLSVKITLDDGLSQEIIDKIENCDNWEQVKPILEGLTYEMEAGPEVCHVSRLGAKKGKGSSLKASPDDRSLVKKKYQDVASMLPKILSDYPDFFNDLFEGMTFKELKSLQAKFMTGPNKYAWRSITCYLNYANLGSNPIGFAKNTDQGIYKCDRTPDMDELTNWVDLYCPKEAI